MVDEPNPVYLERREKYSADYSKSVIPHYDMSLKFIGFCVEYRLPSMGCTINRNSARRSHSRCQSRSRAQHDACAGSPRRRSAEGRPIRGREGFGEPAARLGAHPRRRIAGRSGGFHESPERSRATRYANLAALADVACSERKARSRAKRTLVKDPRRLLMTRSRHLGVTAPLHSLMSRLISFTPHRVTIEGRHFEEEGIWLPIQGHRSRLLTSLLCARA